MGRVAALLAAAAVTLSGCAVTTAPEPGLSEAERQRFQERSSDGYWEYTGLPDDQRPASASVITVEPEEWPVRFVDCMNAAGFDNYAFEGGGYVSSVQLVEPREAEMLATYTCSTSFWVDAGWFNDAEMNYLYDFYEQELVPCLAVHDAEVWGAPTREEFTDAGGWWHPYLSFRQVDQERIYADETVPIACPPKPPGIDSMGYERLFDQF